MAREKEASFDEMLGLGARAKPEMPEVPVASPQQEASFDEMLGVTAAPPAPEPEKPPSLMSKLGGWITSGIDAIPSITSANVQAGVSKAGKAVSDWFTAPLETDLFGGTAPTSSVLGLAPRMNDAGQVVDEQGKPIEVKSQRSLQQWLQSGPTLPPRGFVGQASAIVEDMAKFAPLMAEWMFYDLPKAFTDPLVEYVSKMHELDVARMKEGLTNEQLAAKQGEVGKRALLKLGEGIYQQLRGLQGFMLSPLGYYAPEDDPKYGWAFSWESFKKNWTERPFSTAVALTPLVKAAVRVKAGLAAGRKPAPVNPTVPDGVPAEFPTETDAALAIDASRRAREAAGEPSVLEQVDLAKAYDEASKGFEEKVRQVREKKEVPVEPSPIESAPLGEGMDAEIEAEKAERVEPTPAEAPPLSRAKNTEEPAVPAIEPEPSSLVERKLEPKIRKRVRKIKEEAAKPATPKKEEPKPVEPVEKDFTELTDDELDAMATEAAINEKIPVVRETVTETPSGLDRFRLKLLKRWAAESQGQEILDKMEEKGESPQQVAQAFWTDTYFKLPAEAQEHFRRQFKANTGSSFEGTADPLSLIDLGNTVEHLEGGERGFVSLMKYANEQAKDLSSEKPAAPAPRQLLKPSELAVEELPDESGFATDAELTAIRAKQYRDRPKLEKSSPDAALMKRVNDVNRWRHGEEVNIADVRAELDMFAENVDAVESWFGNHREFVTFRDTVREAASWAKKVERGDGGTTLSMGVDPTRLADLVRRIRGLSGIGNLDVRNKALRDVANDLASRDEALALMNERKRTSAEVKELSAKGDFDGAMRVATEGQHLREVAEESGKLESIDARLGVADPVGSVKLRMGLDVDELSKTVEDAFDAVIRAKALPPMSNRLREAFKKGRRSWLDSSGNIKEELRKEFGKLGELTAQALALTKGATGEALRVWESVYKPIFGKLNSADLELLNRIAFARRVLQIDEIHGLGKIKHPGGTAVNYEAYLLKLKGEIGAAKFEDLWKRASVGFEVAKQMLKELKDAGVITPELYEKLKRFDYTQREMIEMLDPTYVMKVGSNPGTVRESGVTNIRIGKESEVLETSLPTLLQNIIIRGKNRIAWNNANQMMADLARTSPDHPMIALTKEQGGRGIPENFQRFEYYDKGEKKAFGLHPDWAQEWVRRTTDVSYEVARLMRWASGSPIVRMFATGINPAFALTNPFRDLARNMLVSQYYVEMPGSEPGSGRYVSTYSPHLPVAVLQTARNVARVLPDAIFKQGRYVDFVKEGGSPQFLVRYGLGNEPMRSFYVGKTKHAFEALTNALAYVGEVGELVGRLSLREQAIEKGMTSKEATFLARDILDPSQGGGVSKVIDNALPYFNITIQANRGLFRAIGRSPAEMGYKIAQLMAVSAALHVANRLVHGAKYEEFSDRDKQANWILPMAGATITDEYGNERQLGVKIPKDQNEMFFSYLAESIMDKMTGRKFDVDGVVTTLAQLAPISSASQLIPPSVQTVINLVKGYDFWTNEKYWKGNEDVEKYAQYKEGQTPAAAIAVGAASKKVSDLLGTPSAQISPVALVGALKTMVVGNSVYGQLAGAGLQKMLDDYAPEDRALLWSEALARAPVSNRFVTLSHPLNAIRPEVDEVNAEVQTRRWQNTTRFDRWAKSALVDKTATIDDVVENAILPVKDPNEQKRLIGRLEFGMKIQDLPHHAFWMQMEYVSTPEARAKVFYRELQRVDENTRTQLLAETGRVGSLFSKEFWGYYAQEVQKSEKR